MALSISNSKYYVIFLLCFLAVMMVLLTEFYFRDYYSKFDPNEIEHRINKEDPDVIILGNSMLGLNVNKRIFDQTLSKLVQRDVKTTFLTFSGSHGALYYLIIKNQIVRSKASGIPLLIIDNSPNAFASNGILGAEQVYVRSCLSDHEDLFLNKYFDRFFRYRYYLRSLSTAFYYAPGCSRILLNLFADSLSRIMGFDHYSAGVMRARFNRMGYLRPGQSDRDDDVPDKIRYEGSFLPYIFKESSRFKLTFVVTHRSPKSFVLQPPNSKKDYFNSIKEFKEYLQQNGAVLLDMNQFKELNDDALYIDGTHNNPKGAVVNSVLLAKAIYEAGLIK